MLSHRVPLHETGLLVSPHDDVVVAKRPLDEGLCVEIPGSAVAMSGSAGGLAGSAGGLAGSAGGLAGSAGGGPDLVVTLRGPVTPGNRFALREIPAGAMVRQYGQPIGTSRGILAGDPVTLENLAPAVPKVRTIDESQQVAAPAQVPPEQRPRFAGFRRPDGRVGTRNWVLIVPTSMCASHEATQIALRAEATLWSELRHPNVDGVVAIPHNRGCGCPEGDDVETVLRTLAAYADHPNVGGVVVLHLGCEKTNRSMLRKYLEHHGGLSWEKPNVWIGIQESGGTREAITRGLAAVEAMLPEVDRAKRSECDTSDLILGVECGGSDGFSGLSANPALGNAADRLIANGGATILSEVPEFCGAEHLLAARAKDAETARAVYALVDWYAEHAARHGGDLGQNPSPGNVAGGLLNITIKSLGAIAKGGTTRVEGTLGYGQRLRSPGLHLMQGPGYDQESVPGLVACGANVVVFTTGRGSTIGNAIVPVIKLATNTEVHQRMRGDLDLSAGGIVDGVETVEQVGQRVFEHLIRVAGKEVLAKAEETQHREFQIWAPQPLSL